MPATRRRVIRAMCPMSCHPTLCGMLVEIEDGRLINVMGDQDNPDSQGFLCVRGQGSREIIGNPGRLLHPLVRHRRKEDAWREATWDEALDFVVTRMQAKGRQAVGISTGHGNAATNYDTRIGSDAARLRGLSRAQAASPPHGVAAITDSLLSPAARHADLVLPVEAEPVSFVDAQCAPQAIIATLLIEYGLRARDRTEAGLGSFERLAVRHAIFHTDD